MNDLALITPEQLPGNLTTADVESVVGYATNATAASTRVAYDQDMTQFRHWCTARGLCALPAAPASVAAYLATLADSGRKAAGIGRACAGIAWHHRRAGVDPSPTAHQGVKETMRGIRRTIGAATQGKAPIVADMLMQMLKHCPDTLAGKRDRALLSLCFAGAFRRSEVVALEVSDLTATPDGYRIRIRRSKTDAAGLGQEIAVIRGVRIQPVAAVEIWLEASGITEGPIFRAVALGSRMSATAMTSSALARLIKRYCRKIGIDPTNYSGHSMRSGYVTSAVEVNAPLLKIAEQTRHASLDMLRRYSRRVDLFKEHSGAGFL